MEEKQISDKEVENISTDCETTLEKERTASSPFLSSTKSYSETHIESTTLDHTWKIHQFTHFSEIKNTITFPSVLEIGQCEILMNVSRRENSQINALFHTIKLYILTNNSFTGLCTTTVMRSEVNYNVVVSSRSISGLISNMTLLIDVSEKSSCDFGNTITIHCKFEIFRNLINKTIRMNLLPSSSEISKDVTCFEDSTFDEFQSKNEESIKFIVGEKKYVVSKKLLCDTNSSYFKYMCLTHKENEKDMTNELVTDDEVESFKQILLYIITGSTERCDYDMLKDLLIAADKYDVQTLKLTCEHYLLHCITVNNAVKLIQLAFSFNAKFLETHSATFIKFYIKEIRNTKEFRDLPQGDLNKIMELIEKSKIHDVSTYKFLSPFVKDKKFTLANM